MTARHPCRFWLATIGLLWLSVAGACNGRIGPGGKAPGETAGAGAGTGRGGAQMATGTGGTDSGSQGGTGGTDIVPITTKGPSPAESAGVLAMRRLTYREYDHMLADLLGDTTAPAEGGNAWSPDAYNEVGFVSPDSVPDLLVDLYNLTTNSVVDAAVQAVAAGRAAGKLVIPCKNPSGVSAETTCATQFITTFGQQAFRRPVAMPEQNDLLQMFSTVRGLGLGFTESIGAIVKAMLQSPNFIYHWEIGPTPPKVSSDGLVPLTPWQLASRLASLLWETTPDDALLQAAQSGQLATPEQLASQVTRMLADPRAANGLFSFHAQWLFNFGSQGRDLTQPLDKSSPLYTGSVANSIQTEFAQFVSSVYAGDGTLQALFTAPYTYVNHDLAAIYGVSGPSTGFAKVSLDPTQRGGLFTQTAWLATLASDSRDNPIYRGLSIYVKVLCGNIGSPPPNVPKVTFMEKGTTRQSFEAHGMASCAANCHNLFDPPGFAFENYDGIGQYRTTEAGQPVDATGSFVTPAKATLTFENALDLAKQLAQSEEAQSCIDRQWTRYLLGRPETAADAGSMSVAYQKAAATAGFSVRDLVTSLVQSKAFMYRQPASGETL